MGRFRNVQMMVRTFGRDFEALMQADAFLFNNMYGYISKMLKLTFLNLNIVDI